MISSMVATGNNIILWQFRQLTYLRGGKGNDYLEGGRGNDIYEVGLGDGHTVINNREFSKWWERTHGLDTLRFLKGIKASDITLSRSGFYHTDLRFTIQSTRQTVTISNFF